MIRRASKARDLSARRPSMFLESLESRQLLSADAVISPLGDLSTTSVAVQAPVGLTMRPVAAPTGVDGSTVTPNTFTGPGAPYTPAQIKTAYGFDTLTKNTGYTGAGQTIAIIDAYDDPTIASDLNTFSSKFGLPTATFTKVYTNGGSGSTTTAPAYNSGWAGEIALDVEWAHAIAPGASILLVEAPGATDTALFGAVQYVTKTYGSKVAQISMSFGGGEFSGQTTYDANVFKQPGISMFASSGDSGVGVEYPAASPYVTGVGGTTLNLDTSNNRTSETVWAGSGGGTSSVETEPSYQTGFQTSGKRDVPDVSYDADPNTGVYTYDSSGGGTWYAVGGTSISAPQWAGLTALVNQGRAANGLTSIGTGLTFGLNTALYSLAGGSSYKNANGDFLDITSGNNSTSSTTGVSATTGYDAVTGLGSPIANKLVPDLVSYGTSTTTTPTTPTVGDASFETVVVGAGNYQYNPTGSAWTFTGNSGVTGNSSPFTASNPSAPAGTQVAFVQMIGSISQSITFASAGSYNLSALMAQRGNYGYSNQVINVLVDGTVVGSLQSSSTSYQAVATGNFTVNAGVHTITLQGTVRSNDETAFLDSVALNPVAGSGTGTGTGTGSTNSPTVGDAGFETVVVGAGNYQYNPTGSAWTFTGNSGVTGNSSPFTASNPSAPAGTQVAFVQMIGSISQSITFASAGSYNLSALMAQRGNYGYSNQVINVLVDGTVVGSLQSSSTSYQAVATGNFTVNAGVHTITLQGTVRSNDETAFLDSVALNPGVTSSSSSSSVTPQAVMTPAIVEVAATTPARNLATNFQIRARALALTYGRRISQLSQD